MNQDNIQERHNRVFYKMQDLRTIMGLLQQKEIPESWPSLISTKPLTIREEILGYCGYCLLSYDWIGPLSQWIGNKRCLEIMCGSGALSKSLQNCGVDIIATDDHSWNKEHAISWFVDSWTNIEQRNAVKAIEQYGRTVDFIICSWPFKSEDCYNALRKMREINPNAIMIYIGEWYGGATASESFFAAAQRLYDTTFEAAVQNFISFYGIHDKPYLIK